MDDKTCRELLPAYLEGGLTDAERASVEAHLERSAECRERLAELEGLDTLLAGLPREVDVPADLTERILAATLGEATGHHDRPRSDDATAAAQAEAPSKESDSVGDEAEAAQRAANEKRPTLVGRTGGQAPARTTPPTIVARSERGREDRKRGRSVALRWATAAAVLITAILGWWFTRSGPDGGDGSIPGVEGPTRVVLAARMFTARNGVGRPPADATYRVYGPGVAKVFHDLTVMGIVPALSWQNLKIVQDAPFVTARTDADGRLVVDRALDRLDDTNQGWDGAYLVAVEKAGRLGAWGVIELVEVDASGKPVDGVLPQQEIILHPATDRRIRGRVIDANTRQPIEGAVVATPDGTGTAVADANGAFEGVAHLTDSASGRSASFYAFADGYAPKRIRASKMTDGVEFALERRASSHDVTVAVVDARGKPIPRALVLATPRADSSDVWLGMPRSERKRPDVGVTDDEGRLTLRGLYGGRYDVSVHHAYGVLTERTIDASKTGAAAPVKLEVAPEGDGTLDVIVTSADGEAIDDAKVFLTRTDDGKRMTRLVSRQLDLGGETRFRRLGDGEHVVQIFTREGFGFYVKLRLDAGDRAEMRYVLPEGLHRLEGRIHPDRADAVAMVRVQGERARERYGRRRARSHNFAIEVPVKADGTFVTPPLPTLKNVTFLARTKGNADAVFDVTPTTPIGTALRNRAPSTLRITLR